MADSRIRNTNAVLASAPTEQLRRVWLAGLGAFSLTRKHGGQWFGRFAKEGQDLAARSLRFARETVADTRAHAVGVLTPITRRVDKHAGAVERGVGRILHRLGIPTKREIEELTRQVNALSRKLKAAK